MRNNEGHLDSFDETEGDINCTPHRQQFVAQHLDDSTRETLEADSQYFLHQALSTPCLNALQGAVGSHLIDTQGRRILDFHGNSVHQVGYGHPRVIQAIKDQLDTLCFCPRRYTNEPAIELARRLSELAPVRSGEQPPRVLLVPGGSLAIGVALKLVRYATGRFKTISMWDSFHGASLDAVSLGGEALFRKGVGPLLPGCIHVPAYSPDGIGRDSADYIDYVLEKEGDVAAVVAEPMRWTTVVPPPADYWKRVRASCDRHGALLVIDEIPACLGRTGKMFCIEHFDVEPDILVIGKGLGGGVFPLAAIVARGDLNVAGDRAIGHYTHEKSPVGSAAALATLDVIDDEQLLTRANELGQYAIRRLQELKSKLHSIRDVRGIGLQIGVELETKSKSGMAERILYGCLERGLSFKVSDGNVLTLSPPLTISRAEMDEALDILSLMLAECD